MGWNVESLFGKGGRGEKGQQADTDFRHLLSSKFTVSAFIQGRFAAVCIANSAKIVRYFVVKIQLHVYHESVFYMHDPYLSTSDIFFRLRELEPEAGLSQSYSKVQNKLIFASSPLIALHALVLVRTELYVSSGKRTA
jgi:hypothetical protein